jgi:hypothetical protein
MDSRQELALIPKNKNEVLHVALEFYKGVMLIDVRSFVGEKATRKGLTLQKSAWIALLEILPEILDGMEEPV